MSGFLAQVQQQTLTILPSRVRFLLLKHLPPSHAGRLIEFHSGMLHPTLVAAVKACVFLKTSTSSGGSLGFRHMLSIS